MFCTKKTLTYILYFLLLQFGLTGESLLYAQKVNSKQADLTDANSGGLISQGKVVALNDFISSYMAHSYDLKNQYEVLRSSKGDKLIAESADELNLTASAGYSGSTDVTTGINSSGNPTSGNLNGFAGSLGLSKKFSASGTSVSVSDTYGTGSISNNSANSNSLTVSVLQPVLKDFFGFLDRIPIKQTALALKSNEILYKEQIETNIVDAIELYLQWVGYYKERDILKDIITNNQVMFRQTRAQLAAGIAEVSDLEISRNAVIQYQQRLLTNTANYESILLQLNDYMKVEMIDIPDMNVLKTMDDLPQTSVNPNFIRSIRSLNYLLEKSKLGLDYARNNYLPSLDVVAQYSYNSGDSNSSYYTYNGTSSTSGSGVNNFFVGAQFSMPIFFMDARGQEMRAVSQYEQTLLQRDQAVRDIIRNEKDYRQQIELSNENIQQQTVLISSLRRQVVSQRMQYRRGTLDLSDLITGMNDLSNALLNENTLRIQTYQLYNQYLQLIDKLYDDYHSTIPKDLVINDADKND